MAYLTLKDIAYELRDSDFLAQTLSRLTQKPYFYEEPEYTILNGNLYSVSRDELTLYPEFTAYINVCHPAIAASDSQVLKHLENISSYVYGAPVSIEEGGYKETLAQMRLTSAIKMNTGDILGNYSEVSGNRRRNVKRVLSRIHSDDLQVKPFEANAEMMRDMIPVVAKRFNSVYALDNYVLTLAVQDTIKVEALGLYRKDELVAFMTYTSNCGSIWQYQTFLDVTGGGYGKEAYLLGAQFLYNKYGNITLDSTNGVHAEPTPYNSYKEILGNTEIPYFVRTYASEPLPYFDYFLKTQEKFVFIKE